ncbi:uncharacterized protein LOC105219304 [Zeugodacus cucurbitae]|uniref:uncharacterized protein LOC105219304 n=1 Tax=Zeugodacus cucurbitae TaxID=28588 RepID=UPI0005968128|nr:uncharacterized protein LOC105219304 [Zeugodacus cucurbitae]
MEMLSMIVRIIISAGLLPLCCVEAEILTTDMQLSHMSSAILHYHANFFSKRAKGFSLSMLTRDDDAVDYFTDLLTSVLPNAQEVKVEINVAEGMPKPKKYDLYNMLMIDSYEALVDMDPGFHAQQNDFSEFYLIAMPPVTNHLLLMSELKAIFDYCWRHYILNVDVLVEVNGTGVELYTYFPFSPQRCKSTVPIQLNRGKSITELSATALFPDKVRNFHGCTITAVLWDVPPYISLPKREQGELQFGGLEGELLNLLIAELNIDLNYTTPPRNEKRGLILPNGKLTGAIKMLAEKSGDLSLGCFRRTQERATVLTSSISFYQTTQVFAVLERQEPWSTYEILTYPFNIHVWSSLLFFYLVPIFIAFILHRLSVRLLHFIFGILHVREMFFMWTGILLSQIAIPEPSANFARYIFVMWLLLTFVLRSSYQALLYDFFSTQKVIAAPATLDQLIQREYKLVVTESTADSMSGIKALRNREIEVLALNMTDIGIYIELEGNPEKNFVASTPSDFLKYYMISEQKYSKFTILKEDVFLHHISVYFTKHSYLKLPVNRILRNLRAGGIIEHWSLVRELHANKNGLDKQALTLTQLYGIFVIQCLMWVAALLVFLVEYVRGYA